MLYALKHEEYFGNDVKAYVKVGCTFRSDVDERIRELQVGNPRPLYLYSQCPGDKKDEAKLKRKLRPFRSSGGKEWFHFNNESRTILDNWFGK